MLSPIGRVLDTKSVYSFNFSSPDNLVGGANSPSKRGSSTWSMKLDLRGVLASVGLNDFSLSDYEPKTELGRILLRLRRNYILSGGKLLTEEELEDEIKSRRGARG